MTAHHRERGSAAIEVAVAGPVLVLVILAVVFGGRVAIARQAVDMAADAAARAASISRTRTEANALARRTAATAVSNQDLACRSIDVSVDTRAFSTPVGTPGVVHATVACRLDLSDLALIGIPATYTIVSTRSSPLDTYRARR